ncbi:spermatogenesis-associated protein 48 [Salarias fasciatus]|uniref:spermatogenesis-associated protein 48 n=1 Tax=Salarias fasciatus TaxID=181472 RepID=UPI0011764B73|nr:spermatogenesis-associated protein 48 [Salarias fasciatus]
MAAAADPLRPFPAELQVIRRLNSSLRRDGSAGRAGSPRHHHPPPPPPPPLAPSRDDVPLLDPCCGLLSAGALAHLGVKGQWRFIDLHRVPCGLCVPAGLRRRPQTSRALGDLWRRVRLWTDDSPPVLRFRSTSAPQRSCEEVWWNTKLPGRLNAADKTLEKLEKLVCERPWTRRYDSRPQLWQSVGAEWSRQQLRLRSDATKPVSFCSRSPRVGQIPLYTGTIGSENMDNVDNMEEDFHPLTLKRSVVPPYTPTAHRAAIPGYTGRASGTRRAAAAPPAARPEPSLL